MVRTTVSPSSAKLIALEEVDRPRLLTGKLGLSFFCAQQGFQRLLQPALAYDVAGNIIALF